MQKDDAHQGAEKYTGQVQNAIKADREMLQGVKAHDPCKEYREGFDDDQAVLGRLEPHGFRRAGDNDQKGDQGIDEKNFHDRIAVHGLLFTDLAAALQKAVYQCQQNPDHGLESLLFGSRCFCRRKE